MPKQFKRIKPPKNALPETEYWKRGDVIVSISDAWVKGKGLFCTSTVRENGEVKFAGTPNEASDYLLKQYGIDDGAA